MPSKPEIDKQRKKDVRANWSTTEELKYLRNIGKHKKSISFETRKQWLNRYLRAMDSRTRWGTIDKAKVEKYIKLELKSMGEGL